MSERKGELVRVILEKETWYALDITATKRIVCIKAEERLRLAIGAKENLTLHVRATNRELKKEVEDYLLGVVNESWMDRNLVCKQ
jgi:hypothetical protein